MNQLCRVCGEPAAGFHFGAFTCEGCKSFFGRTYNNLSQIHECKNGGACVINKQNRTSCKACRLKKCLVVGMSKSGSRYGRRSNWFKIHCLLQEQAAQVSKSLENGGPHGTLGVSQPSMTSLSPTIVTSLSPSPLTSLSPMRNEEENKLESSALSSPESIGSECSLDGNRRGHNSLSISRRNPPNIGSLQRDSLFRDSVPGNDFVANLGLYSLHPGLSLLHASQFYSRLYPPVLYPSLAHHQHLLQTSANHKSLSRSPPLPSSSPHSTNSPKIYSSQSRPGSSSPEFSPLPPSPPGHYSSNQEPSTPSSPPIIPKKRTVEEIEDKNRPWSNGSSTSQEEQEGPIDLTVKRKKVRVNSPERSTTPDRNNQSPHSVPSSPPIMSVFSLPNLTSTPLAPMNLTTKA